MSEGPSATSSVAAALGNARRLLQSNGQAAARQAREIIKVEPGIAEAHLILAAALRGLGQTAEARLAEQAGLDVAANDLVLRKAASEIAQGRLPAAEHLLRRFMEDSPNDPEALRLLAAVANGAGRWDSAEALLRRALRVAPGFDRAKGDLDKLIATQAAADARPSSADASPPEGSQEFDAALELNRKNVEAAPSDPRAWLSYGHVLRISGAQPDSIDAYRKAIALKPDFGEAWWALADLKTVTLSEDDVRALETALSGSQSSLGDRAAMHFALGKALSDQGAFDEAFDQYSAGNGLKRKTIAYDPEAIDELLEESLKTFDQDFFKSRAGYGTDSRGPIFIVGMPRSGSTLVEQILASHSAVEGTEELVHMGNLASVIADGRRAGLEKSSFVQAVAGLTAERANTIGAAYLTRAAGQRRSNRPHFIDKMPRNWMYLPLIRLALPKAKIIDVRRDPLDCGWSNFRQLFADGGEFSYDLSEIGRYYRAYTGLVSHFEAVAPGAIHRVQYEELVEQPEREVRRILDYLSLRFEPSCLEFHRNPRAVKTASSEQVRQPLNQQGIGVAEPFRPYLQPLIAALADTGRHTAPSDSGDGQ